MQPQPISGRIKPGSRTGFGASRRYIIAGLLSQDHPFKAIHL